MAIDTWDLRWDAIGETRNGPWPRSPSERRRKVSSPGHREGSWLDGCRPLLILFVDEMYHLWFNEWKNYLQFYLQFHQLSAALCGSAISGTVQEGLLVIRTVLEHSPSPSNSLNGSKESVHQLSSLGGLEMFGTWILFFHFFPYIGNNNPNWLIFFRGVETKGVSAQTAPRPWHPQWALLRTTGHSTAFAVNRPSRLEVSLGDPKTSSNTLDSCHFCTLR